MINVDQLEILLRTVPQYFLFGALSLFLFSWIDKKPKLSLIAEALLLILGLSSFLVLISGMIPSPTAEGIVTEHIESVIKILFMITLNGVLALTSLGIRFWRKKAWLPLVFSIFVLSVVIFFSTTHLSKIKFELNRQTTEIIN